MASLGGSLPRAWPVLGGCGTVLSLVTCSFPTDGGGEVFLTIEAPSAVVTRGQTMLLTARAWRPTTSGAPEELRGLSIQWTSDDARIAVVAEAEGSNALVTGVAGGRVAIRAISRDFEDAEPGTLPLRIANTIEVDSVRPAEVRYGDQVTLYGVGFDRIDRVALGEAELIPDRGSLEGIGTGAERIRAWVPYPATSGRVVAIATQGFSAPAQDSTHVAQLDLYDIEGSTPPVIDLNGPPILGADTLFHVPGLGLLGGERLDGYRFLRADTTRPLSIIVTTTSPVVTFFEPVLLADVQIPDSFPEFTGPPWALGTSLWSCREAMQRIRKPYARNATVSIVRAFKEAPASRMALGVYGDPPGRYAITVVDRYVTADSRIVPDRFEENDYCAGADANAQDPARHIDLTVPFADTLTIDNPFELDWIRFTVPGEPELGVTVPITIRTAARPFGASDSTDLGLYFTRGAFGALVAESHQEGSSETVNFEVEPGDWYAVVADEAGVATRYAICIAVGATCSFLAEPEP
jgi:hypothetical protein